MTARFTAHGHPALRATHGKTLEFTSTDAVTARATCVIGVSAGLPTEAMAGPIRLHLTIGAETVTVEATGNSAWSDRDSAVIRRSHRRLADTYATEASLAAADLPRAWRARLADPATVLQIEVSRRPSPPYLVRFRLGGSDDSRLRAEAAAADAVLAEDPGARTRLAALGIAVSSGPVDGRVLSVTSAGGPGPVADEVIGWPPELALPAALGGTAPTLLATGVPPSGIAVLAAASPQAGVVFQAEADQLERIVAAIGRPPAPVRYLAADDPERPRPEAGSLGRGAHFGLVGPVPREADLPPVDPAELVRRLLAEGTSARSVALALAGLPGWSRRAAYDFVLSLSS